MLYKAWVRFWRKVERLGPDACWPWRGTVDSYGYGVFAVTGRFNRKAHRLAYEYERGVIPDGLTIDHLCRMKLCMNPAHMEPVTASVNTGRANPQKQHCLRGHAFTQENTYRKPNGSQGCRACNAYLHRGYRVAPGGTSWTLTRS